MKKIILIATIVCFVSISFAFMRDETVKYENLKVLPKNIDKHGLDSVMKHFSASLGVRCSHCHVRNNDEKKDFNFASDDNKNKLVARGMFKMMNKINKKYFKEDNEEHRENSIPIVSCYSCHHGQEKPENKAPAPSPPGPGMQRGPEGQPRPGDQPKPTDQPKQ